MTSPKPSMIGLNPGDRLDKFEVTEQIGAGGMSIVWKGYDRLLDRPVAIKQLNPDPGSDEEVFRERFRAEAHIQRRLGEADKHLVRILDFIDEPRGLFIVMEYVDGQSLEQLIAHAKGPLDQRQALGIIGATALALQALHREGIVHRDLKPSNILLPRGGGLKVCDFGLAALIEDQDALSLGSVRYMAPELFGDEDVDGRADIYALGMIAYEMLAGREKFNDAFKIVLRDQRNQALRWMKWHTNLRAKPTPLSQLNKDVPATLDDLVGRMMDKDPTRRIASAQELIEAIRRHFAGKSAAPTETLGNGAAATPGVPGATAEPTARIPRKSRLPLILAVVLGVQILVIGGVYLHKQNEQRVALQQRLALDEEAFNRARQELQANNFESAYTVFDKLSKVWENEPRLGRASKVRALWCLANIKLAEGDYEAARQALAECDAMNIFDRDLVQDLRREADKRDGFAKKIREIERHIDSVRFDQARLSITALRTTTLTTDEDKTLKELAERVEDQASRRSIENTIMLAKSLASEGKLQEAVALLTEANERQPSTRFVELSRELSTQMGFNQTVQSARSAEAGGKLAEAIRLYEQAMKLNPSSDFSAQINRHKAELAFLEAQRLEAAGDIAGAAAKYTEALAFNDKHSGSTAALNRLKVADQRNSYIRAGDAAQRRGEYGQAISLWRKALEMGEDPSLRTKIRAATIDATIAAAEALVRQNKVNEARDKYDEALRLDPNNATARRGKAEADRWLEYKKYLDSGDEFRNASRFREAKRDYRKAREILNTPDIKQRLDDVEYDSVMASAKADIAVRNWATARSWLAIAARLRQTEEVQRLMAEVDKNDPRPNPPEPQPEEDEPQ